MFHFTDTQWKVIFKIPICSLRDVKTRYFQFKFLHRILGTNYLKSKMKIVDESTCSLCGRMPQTLEHLFWNCQAVSSFILDMEQIFLGTQFSLSKEDFFFGYKFELFHPFNFLIFHLKHYIFRQANFNNVLKSSEFVYMFSFLLKVEKSICIERFNKLVASFANCKDLCRL